MKKLQMLKKDKRGMTLIELLVVLIIFAIIAAFSIPAMLGFVDDAKGKAYIAEARTCYIAAQTIATEETAFGKTDADITKRIVETDTRLSSLVGSDVITGATLTGNVTNGAVDSIIFTKDGSQITIIPGEAAKVEKVS